MISRAPRSTLFTYTTLSRCYTTFVKSPRAACRAWLSWAHKRSRRRGSLTSERTKQGQFPNELRKRCNPILRSEEHTSELQSLTNLVCRLLLEKKKKKK